MNHRGRLEQNGARLRVGVDGGVLARFCAVAEQFLDVPDSLRMPRPIRNEVWTGATWGRGRAPKGENLKLGAEHLPKPARRLLWFSWPSPEPEALKLGAEHLPTPCEPPLMRFRAEAKISVRAPAIGTGFNSAPVHHAKAKGQGHNQHKNQLRTLSPSVSRCQCLEMPYQSAACQGIVMFAAVFRAEKESSSDSFARASSISSDACFFVNCAGALTPSLPR